MSRGTSRKAVAVKPQTFTRLTAYLDEHEPKQSKSGFLEAALAEEHPDVFGDAAPLPPTPTAEEVALTKERQAEARKRVDEKRASTSQFFPGTAPEKPKRKRSKPPETAQEPEKPEAKRPPAHLQPKPEPTKKEPERDPDDFPPSVIFF